MKYFIDFEFIEGFKKPFFGKKRHFIDMISVGIYCEDGRSYYAISNEFNPKRADEWVKKNVISTLEHKSTMRSCQLTPTLRYLYPIWQSNKRIVRDILAFFGCYRDQLFWRAPKDIQVYGYYSDYDWVLLCSLFGRMIDLPKGFPMYCIDLKQTMDEKASEMLAVGIGTHSQGNKWYPDNFNHAIEVIKGDSKYPKNTQEHNAFADAKWNFDLYKFLQTI